MTDLNTIPSLSEDELSTLGQLLEREAESQDSFDFFAVHGFITALCVSPLAFDEQLIWSCAFDESHGFTKVEVESLKVLFRKLEKEIQAWLDSGSSFPVPCDLTLLTEDEDFIPLESWAMGFMSAVILQEADWYSQDEEQIAKYLFPIMYASGLFMDEPEMADIDEDADLSDKVCSTIPDIIVEIFLTFHAR